MQTSAQSSALWRVTVALCVYKVEMKSKPTKSAAAGSKNKVKKTPEGVSGPTLSRKLRDKTNGETSKSGMRLWKHLSPVTALSLWHLNGFVCLLGTALKSTGVQKRGWDGSILHYIYKSTLGQSLHSQMRQVREPDVVLAPMLLKILTPVPIVIKKKKI